MAYQRQKDLAIVVVGMTAAHCVSLHLGDQPIQLSPLLQTIGHTPSSDGCHLTPPHVGRSIQRNCGWILHGHTSASYGRREQPDRDRPTTTTHARAGPQVPSVAMSRKGPNRPYTQATRPEPSPGPALDQVFRGGLVQRCYNLLEPDERHAIIAEIGLKACQRIGHRYKIVELRTLTDLDSQWTVVDQWLGATEAAGGAPAMGDLFEPLLRVLIERARELLGDHSDEPEAEHLLAMGEALAAERSFAQVRVLLAAVVELDFAAAPEVLQLAAIDPRFALPTTE